MNRESPFSGRTSDHSGRTQGNLTEFLKSQRLPSHCIVSHICEIWANAIFAGEEGQADKSSRDSRFGSDFELLNFLHFKLPRIPLHQYLSAKDPSSLPPLALLLSQIT
jgi:hypothetical protein